MKNEKRMKGRTKPGKNGAPQSKLLCWGVILPYHKKKKKEVLKFEFDSNIFIRHSVSASEKGKYDCLMICEKSVYFNYKSCKGKKHVLF